MTVSQIIIAHHDAQGELEFYSTIMRGMSERTDGSRPAPSLRRAGGRQRRMAPTARLKDEFVASMSHELRTPFYGVLSMAEAMLEQVYGSVRPPGLGPPGYRDQRPPLDGADQ